MRIVITKNGKILFKELEDESPSNLQFKIKSLQTSSYSKLPIIYSNDDLLKKFNAKANNNKFIMTVLRNKKISNKRRSNSLLAQKSLENFLSEDNSKIDTNELNKVKKVKLNTSRMNISQFFMEKYDSFDENYKKKLHDFNNIFTKNEKQSEENDNDMGFALKNKNNTNPINMINNNNTSKFSNTKINKINIGDIISKGNLHTLRNQMSKYNIGSNDVRFPLDENNMKSFNFRSKYENKQATDDDMNLILNYGINTDKSSIIKYFKQNKKINPHYIENLLKYDEKKMTKLNKLLDIMLQKKEKENKKDKFLLLSKLNDDKDRNEDFHLKKIENVIKRSNSIINEHSSLNEKLKFWRMKAYQEDTENIKKKYWVRYDVERFLKNSQKKVNKISFKSQKIKKLYPSHSTPNFLTNY